jgi:SEC-C motif-containing protein
MRSRYCAFVLEDRDYLLATWHPRTRRRSWRSNRHEVAGAGGARPRLIDTDHAEVEFVARHRAAGGRAVRLHERSRFVREQGRWFYVDGDIR